MHYVTGKFPKCLLEVMTAVTASEQARPACHYRKIQTI
jgi:hypothetical protein